jgi:hypothetical protein
MRPKADAAWNLHELTRGARLTRVRAVLGGRGDLRCGGPGQLRGRERVPRRAGLPPPGAGLPAVSLAWGLWADASGMTGHLSEEERGRITPRRHEPR